MAIRRLERRLVGNTCVLRVAMDNSSRGVATERGSSPSDLPTKSESFEVQMLHGDRAAALNLSQVVRNVPVLAGYQQRTSRLYPRIYVCVIWTFPHSKSVRIPR